MWATGYESGDDDAFDSTVADLNYTTQAIHLFGAQAVREALYGVSKVFEQIGVEMADSGGDGGPSASVR